MIYFMQPTDGGPVKIGFTEDLDTRHRQLERHYGKTLAILATMEGGLDEERELHARFVHLQLGQTEQFRPAADLMEFIRRPLLAYANPDAVESLSSGRLVRIAPDLATKAKYLAAQRGMAMSDLLSDLLRPVLDREFLKAGRELLGGEGETGETPRKGRAK